MPLYLIAFQTSKFKGNARVVHESAAQAEVLAQADLVRRVQAFCRRLPTVGQDTPSPEHVLSGWLATVIPAPEGVHNFEWDVK